MDEIYKVDNLAPDYETETRNPILSPGGSGANTGVAVAKLGMRVGVAGLISTDSNGATLRRDFEGAGINTAELLTVPETREHRTGKTIVFVDSQGRRSIYVDQGVNRLYAREAGLRWSELSKSISTARIIHFSSFVSPHERRYCEALVETIPATRLFSFSPGALYAKPGLAGISKFIRRANFIFIYEKQFHSLLENSGLFLGSKLNDRIETFYNWRLENGISVPLILSIKRTRTSNFDMDPSEYITLAYGTNKFEGSVVPNIMLTYRNGDKPPVSGLGAGDALAAGVLSGVLMEKTEEIVETANTGYVLASFASRAVDSRSSLPDKNAFTEARTASGGSTLW